MRSPKSEAGSSKADSAPLLILISAPSGGGKTTLVRTAAQVAPGNDPRHHLHHAPAATWRKGWRGLLFLHGSGVFEARAGGKFSGARHGLWQQLRIVEIGTARQAARGQGCFAERGCAGRGNHPRGGAGGTGVARGAGHGISHAGVGGNSEGAIEKTQCRQRRRSFKNGWRSAKQEVAQWKNFDYLLISTTKQEDLRRMLAIVETEKMRVARSPAPEF